MEISKEIRQTAAENLMRERDAIDKKLAEILGETKKEEADTCATGVFDGKDMIGDDERIYPVPSNYASKSGLVEGDRLKLHFENMVYKQVGPVQRKTIFATYAGNSLIKDESGWSYRVLRASVTYFDIKIGDEVLCEIPEAPGASYAAIKGVTKRV